MKILGSFKRVLTNKNVSDDDIYAVGIITTLLLIGIGILVAYIKIKSYV